MMLLHNMVTIPLTAHSMRVLLLLLVMFYAPWCGHCTRMKPEYITAGQYIQDNDINASLAAVDATKETALSKRFNIKGFPTLIYFRDGEEMWNVNERTSAGIINFIKNPVEPSEAEQQQVGDVPWSQTENDVDHLTDDTFKTILKRKKHALVMFYAPWCGHCKQAKPEFEEAARHFLSTPQVSLSAVDCSVYTATCTQYSVSAYPTFKYLSYYNKDAKDYNGGRDARSFIEFLSSASGGGAGGGDPAPQWLSSVLPRAAPWTNIPGAEHLNHVSQSTLNDALQQYRHLLILFYAPWCEQSNKLKPIFAEVARHFALESPNPTVKLATVDGTVETDLYQRYNIHHYPTIKYLYRGKFLSDYTDKLERQEMINFMLEGIENANTLSGSSAGSSSGSSSGSGDRGTPQGQEQRSEL